MGRHGRQRMTGRIVDGRKAGPMRGAMMCIALALAILVGARFGMAYGFAAFFAMVGLLSMGGPGDDGR